MRVVTFSASLHSTSSDTSQNPNTQIKKDTIYLNCYDKTQHTNFLRKPLFKMLAIILVSDFFFFFTPISYNISAKWSKECTSKRLKTWFHQVYWPFPSVSAAWCSVSPGLHSGSPAVGIPLAWLAPAPAMRSVRNNHHSLSIILTTSFHKFVSLSD